MSGDHPRGVRLGIDVGGTFTDAVAVDGSTHELVGQVKVPTTHAAPEGVALGIGQALQALLHQAAIDPGDTQFIAHATTQATNALLEGDVAPVGIVATGEGLGGWRARYQTKLGDIQLAPEKSLHVLHAFTSLSNADCAVTALARQGAQVIVAAEPFSVDDPSGELAIMASARAHQLLATGTHEITKLYGLRVRTRTAVINGCILPRMMEAAELTAACVRSSGVDVPLMVMRCDGGVMGLDEVRLRPILTMLSGPAAGIAGALMYERVSEGVYLDVGGTSTDISAISMGRVAMGYAQIGGHRTYVPSLDVRSLGLGGGSMLRLEGAHLKDVGPRSAHIAGLDYACFAQPSDILDPKLELFAPRSGDPPDYLRIRCARGYALALTVTCAANVLGYLRPGDYALGNAEAARLAFAPLAAVLRSSVEEAAREVLRLAEAKLSPTVEALMERYELPDKHTVLVGGGGAAAAVVPPLAHLLGLEHKIARNHPVLAPIGVALALVRDVVERTTASPTQEDILHIRREAEEAVLQSGAAAGSVQVHVEFDAASNRLRATASGATEMRAAGANQGQLSEGELQRIVAEQLGLGDIQLSVRLGNWAVYTGTREIRRVFGLLRGTKRVCCVLDSQGVVRLTKSDFTITLTTTGDVRSRLGPFLAAATTYGDAGAFLPEVYVLHGARLLDLSGLQSADQMDAMLAADLEGDEPTEGVAVLCIRRN